LFNISPRLFIKNITQRLIKYANFNFSDCKVKTPRRQALDEAVAKRLWDESARLVKLDFDPFEGLAKKAAA